MRLCKRSQREGEYGQRRLGKGLAVPQKRLGSEDFHWRECANGRFFAQRMAYRFQTLVLAWPRSRTIISTTIKNNNIAIFLGVLQ